jgi:hypothetical protein
MGTKTKVIVDITKETDAEAIKKTEIVIENLGDASAIFTNPPVSILTMTADKDDFIEKTAKAQYGGTNDTLAKNLAREIVNSNYSQDGKYVNLISNGDKAKATVSGYELAKTPSKSLPEDFALENLKTSGSILVFCRQKPKGYIVKMLQYSTDPQDTESWKSGGVTRKIKKVISNLTAGQRVWVRLAVVTDEDIIAYGDPISIIVT